MTKLTNLYRKEVGLVLQILIYLRPKTNLNPIDLKAKLKDASLPRPFIILAFT